MTSYMPATFMPTATGSARTLFGSKIEIMTRMVVESTAQHFPAEVVDGCSYNLFVTVHLSLPFNCYRDLVLIIDR